MTDGRIDVLQHDLATVQKLPVIRRLLAAARGEPSIDIGSGTGHLTAAVLEGRRAIAVDTWLPNLRGIAAAFGSRIRLLQAAGEALPLGDGTVGTVLCSEVLEHVENDQAVLAEMARILRPGGHLVVSVPSLYFRIDTYLRLLGVSTVHDHPGPEQHIRRGYREEDLRAMLAGAGFEVEELVYLFKPFSKLAIDIIALAHLIYQRAIHGRKSWTWDDAVGPETRNSIVFRAYVAVFPILRAVGMLDRVLRIKGGFGVALRARRIAD